MPLTASPVTLSNNPTSPFTSCPEPGGAMTPSLFSSLSLAICSKASRTHSVGALNPPDCNKTITLDASSQSQRPTVHRPQFFVGLKSIKTYHLTFRIWTKPLLLGCLLVNCLMKSALQGMFCAKMLEILPYLWSPMFLLGEVVVVYL